jgi:Flp pilus assembly protein TadG
VRRWCGQSLVELALVAPVLIVLAMVAWDGGGLLREQVILQQAARDGARVAATTWSPGESDAVVALAAQQSAADLPGVVTTVDRPAADSVRVSLTYDHGLMTPVLRGLWGGSVRLRASATFFVPQLTPTPPAVVLSTLIPTATSTSVALPTSTPTVTPTPTATPIPIITCEVDIPPRGNNEGWPVIIQTAASAPITATWTLAPGDRNNIELSVLEFFPRDEIASERRNANSVTVTTPAVPADFYVVFFYNQGSGLNYWTSGTIQFVGTRCP